GIKPEELESSCRFEPCSPHLAKRESILIEVIGFIGGLFLALCAVPQAYKSYQDGHANGMSHSFIWLWCLGEIAMLAYILGKYQFSDLWLILNYTVNTVIIFVIIKYKYFPRV